MLQQDTKLLVKILNEHVAFSEGHVGIVPFNFLKRPELGTEFGGL
jgi:hypothetical protein